MRPLFKSWLAALFERFVALKRAAGSSYRSQAGQLSCFDRYLAQNEDTAPLRREVLSSFLATLDRLSPRGRDNMVSVVWSALAFAQRHGAHIDLPPRPARPPAGHRLREPRLVFDDEMRTILAAARMLGDADAKPQKQRTYPSRSATYATLYGLLFATGMRINEALSLDVGDLDLNAGLITIRGGKFGKTRILPVRASTADALRRCLNDPHRRVGTSSADPLFVSVRGKRLRYLSASKTLRILGEEVELVEPLPRPHDLRHSFTVLQVVSWYRHNCDVNKLLPALSTYLGHVTIDNTRTYLRANGLILHEACKRFAISTTRLDEVLS